MFAKLFIDVKKHRGLLVEQDHQYEYSGEKETPHSASLNGSKRRRLNKSTDREQGELQTQSKRQRKEQLTLPLQQHANQEIESRPISTGNLIRKNHRSNKRQQTTNCQQSNFKKQKKVPLSPDAIELSSLLSELSKYKKYDEAVSLYWNTKYDSIRDGHHACMLIDCCARCGDVNSAELVLEKLEPKYLNVEIYTAMMKAFVHAGKIRRAVELFVSISNHTVPFHHRPNVRTLNTLLRGCLWTAAAPDAESGEIFGGVVSSELAWELYCKMSDAAESLDASSYEYSISLLCQSLRTNEAQNRINEFQQKHNVCNKGKGTLAGTKDQTVLETLSVTYLALGRAFALLGSAEKMWTSIQYSLSATRQSKALLPIQATDGGCVDGISGKNTKRNNKVIAGGKQGWKKMSEESDHNSRMVSNLEYRSHRLSEIESEAIELLKSRGMVKSLSHCDVATRIQRKLYYFSGAGTTDLSSLQNKSIVTSDSFDPKQNHCLVTSWLSFGLSTLTSVSKGNTLINPTSEMISKIFKIKICKGLDDFGRLNLESIFQDCTRPLDIEVGAGFGSWIVQQAKSNPLRNYVAVELRADRVLQTFARSILQNNTPLDNLCVVGSECGEFLRNRLKKGCVSTIYANHPEPPTQTLGGNYRDLQSIIRGSKEPAHMLHSKTIRQMVDCLQVDGKIVVVTDNRLYSRFLAATFCRVMEDCGPILRSLKSNEIKGSALRCSETFEGKVIIFEGNPSNELGFANNEKVGSSYFDRLWRTVGACHSDKKTRYVLVVVKVDMK